ncbi:MAG: hydrogenase iron-sulfur subunit [Nitrospirae bacterium]|nr:hydrogenase iron-sulfur subunit [Nitrospirota bacterium]
MEKKVGVYICKDCGIGEALNIEQLESVAKEYHPAVCKVHDFLCSQEGVQVIKDDIQNEGINTIVIAACSMRVNTDVFSFDPQKYVTERVNLREHVVWCQPPNDENTQRMAEDYLRLGIVRAQKAEPPTPKTGDLEKTILVVGGGVAGLSAALEAARAGYKAVIVEKAEELGGRIKKMKKVLPSKPPYQEPQTPDIDEKIKAVEENPNITVYTNSQVVSIEGEPGMFDVTICKNDAVTIKEIDINEEVKSGGPARFPLPECSSPETVRVGAVVFTIGWKPYDATKLEEPFGYGKFKNVITNWELEEMVSNGGVKRPSDGSTPKSVVFIQCAGQRDENHLPYCSSVCCLTSLKQAKYIREANPDAGAFIIYKDMRTPGLYENFYKSMQDDEGVFLIKGEIQSIEENADGSIQIKVENKLLNTIDVINADMVVLATGMVTNMVPEGREPKELTRDQEYIGEIVSKQTEDGVVEELVPYPIALNLKYRQGPEMPYLKYGFPDSHFICFPYETRRTGIYAAGAARHPMDAAQAAMDGAGAALKAIQCIERTSEGYAVHPRSWDQTFPVFRLESCTQCRRCTVECPFGVLDEDEKATPQEHPYRCRRCGTCMGACPQRIINFSDYSIDMISSMLQEMQVPDESELFPYIVAFICENDAYPAFDMAGLNRLQLPPNFRLIRLRCLGGMNLVWVSDVLSKGADGVILIGCKFGEDYQCHFIKVSQMANERLGKVQETLSRLMLEAERVKMVQLAINEYDQLPQILSEFAEQVKEIGANPYKGF